MVASAASGLRLILPPGVHGHNVSFNCLPRVDIQFQSFEPGLVLGVAEGFRHVGSPTPDLYHLGQPTVEQDQKLQVDVLERLLQ